MLQAFLVLTMLILTRSMRVPASLTHRPVAAALRGHLARHRFGSTMSHVQKPVPQQLKLEWEQPAVLEQLEATATKPQAAAPTGGLEPAQARALFKPGARSMSLSPDEQRSKVEQEIASLLQNKVVKGVGPKLASALLGKFGNRTLIVLRGDGTPEEEATLLEVPRLGTSTLDKIRQSASQWQGLLAALDFSRTHLGALLNEGMIAHLVKTHGEKTEVVVREDPFVLLSLFPS